MPCTTLAPGPHAPALVTGAVQRGKEQVRAAASHCGSRAVNPTLHCPCSETHTHCQYKLCTVSTEKGKCWRTTHHTASASESRNSSPTPEAMEVCAFHKCNMSWFFSPLTKLWLNMGVIQLQMFNEKWSSAHTDPEKYLFIGSISTFFN